MTHNNKNNDNDNLNKGHKGTTGKCTLVNTTGETWKKTSGTNDANWNSSITKSTKFSYEVGSNDDSGKVTYSSDSGAVIDISWNGTQGFQFEVHPPYGAFNEIDGMDASITVHN